MHSSMMMAAGALAFGISFVALAHAGDSNTIYIRQESPAGSTNGNSLSIDQSNANSSTLAGPSISALLPHVGLTLNSALQGQPRPALQYGEDNEATVTMTGNDGVLLLLQNSSPGTQSPQALSAGVQGNTVTANTTIAGNSLGAVIQVGTGNIATLQLDNSQGLIGQFGTGLQATLDVAPGSSGQIIQNGNDSTANLQVAAGNATLVQTGNGLTFDQTTNQAVQVFSTNFGTITINQVGF